MVSAGGQTGVLVMSRRDEGVEQDRARHLYRLIAIGR